MMEKRVLEANQEEIDEEQEAEWYLRRAEAGLSALQNADYVLGWVCMEDDGVSCRSRSRSSLMKGIGACQDYAGTKRSIIRERRCCA